MAMKVDGPILTKSEISDVVINSLPGAFYLQDEQGNYLRWNKYFENISGYFGDEISKLNTVDFFEGDDRARILETIEKVFREGSAEIEITTVNKFGARIPFYLNGRVVNYEGKRCLIGMGIDITERMNAQYEIRKNESQLHALFDNMGGAIFLLDADKRLVLFNSELVKYYNIFRGSSPEPGEPAYAFLDPQKLKRKYEILDDVLAGNKRVVESDFEVNGQKFYFRSWFNPIFVDEKVTGISCYIVDVTSLKNAETANQHVQERLNYHINNSPLAVIEYDRDLKITYWSKRASDIYGWQEDEVIGKILPEFLIYTEDIDKVRECLQGQEAVTDMRPLPNRNYAKDGRVLHTHWYNSMLTDQHGNIQTIMSIIRDISDLWKAEVQREQMASDLIKRNNELEQFTYIVSHNLRSPVASLIGLTGILSKFDLNESEQAEIVAGISQSAHRLDAVIRDLNDILHLKNKIDNKKEAVTFSKLVNDIEESISQYQDNEKFIIDADFSLIDEHYTQKNYITSIFNNLISNGIKYRQQHTDPVIKIRSEVEGNKLVLTFTDNGLGIDLARIGEDMFGLYKRFHNHVEGKGLGLYMVKNQVETLGGKISVTSELNKGTEFRIEFDL